MNLKFIRTSHHMSQDELAKISGLNVRTIQRLENGGKPSDESLKCLAAALNIEINAIIEEPIKTSNQLYPTSTAILLVAAAISILFGAKSEILYPGIGAFFYCLAALFFINTAYKMFKH